MEFMSREVTWRALAFRAARLGEAFKDRKRNKDEEGEEMEKEGARKGGEGDVRNKGVVEVGSGGGLRAYNRIGCETSMVTVKRPIIHISSHCISSLACNGSRALT